jgi:endonuclease III-like uncharacterized protein
MNVIHEIGQLIDQFGTEKFDKLKEIIANDPENIKRAFNMAVFHKKPETYKALVVEYGNKYVIKGDMYLAEEMNDMRPLLEKLASSTN